jgi:1-phosphofructokinase
VSPRVAVFGPNPLLTITLEKSGAEQDDIHLHAGGQGVWVARMAAELGARTTLCGFAGGETGAIVDSLLAATPIERRFVSAGQTGSYVIDRRDGTRRLLAQQQARPASRHEVDNLISLSCAVALDSDALVVCNSYPSEVLPVESYATVVANARENGIPVLVDLSSPRLDAALEGKPDLVKLNDWELAEFVVGPVDGARLRAAAEAVRDRGAGIVVVTRGGEPAFVLHGEDAFELTPPRFGHGSREGCGDSMMGALAAAWAEGCDWREAVVRGAAAGAANFLRHGLGSGSRETVDRLRGRVSLRPLSDQAFSERARTAH